MQAYDKTKNIIQRKLWRTNKNKGIILQTVINNEIIDNTKRPYYGVLFTLTPGYYYFPDTEFSDMFIDLNGNIILPMRHSTFISENNIKFNDGEEWNLVSNIPPNKSKNPLQLDLIGKQNVADTSYLYNQMKKVYGEVPMVRGQKYPTS